ncbi:MAG TPA: energy transducer TonB [Bacteroidota bacterium]|nr:energy transducer TonB [Bacteroidota bacterium]
MAQGEKERPDYPDEIIPLHGKPFRGKILKFEDAKIYVEVTRHKETQIILMDLDSLQEVNKDFGPIKISVWKRALENQQTETTVNSQEIELPVHNNFTMSRDTAAAIKIERDSIFVGAVDRTDTSQNQRKVVDQMPIPLYRSETEYPGVARSRRLQGDVKLRLWIDEKGIPQKWEVAECTDSVFVEPSVLSAMKWQFSPAIAKGVPIGVWGEITFEYIIQQ